MKSKLNNPDIVRIMFLIVILALFLLALTIVVSQVSLGTLTSDESILFQQFCKFPCWRGLTPGVSTIDEVRAIAQNDEFISSGTLREDTTGADTILRWWHTTPQEQSRLSVHDGVLYSIQIIPHLDFSLREIVDAYGEPDGVQALLEPNRVDSTIYIKLILYYFKYGLMIDFYFLGGDASERKFELSPEVPGRGFIVYTPAASLEDFVSPIYGVEGEELQEFMSVIQNWPDFHSIVVIPQDAISLHDIPLILTITPNPGV